MTDIPAFHFEVKKHSFSQLQDGSVKIGLTVHPSDFDRLMPYVQAAAGQRFQCALAAIGDDEQAVEVAKAPMCQSCGGTGKAVLGNPCRACDGTGIAIKTQKTAKPKRKFHDLPRSQQAGMLTKNADFQDWVLSQEWGSSRSRPHEMPIPEYVRGAICRQCGVESRAEFAADDYAGAAWDAILADYEAATGRIAEER